jgi:hypothetical protein
VVCAPGAPSRKTAYALELETLLVSEMRVLRMRRPPLVVLAAAALVVAASTAAIVVVVGSGSGGNALTRGEYLARVGAICQKYGRRLDKIPPPTDPASPGAVFESINGALPILREQARRVRALDPPRELRRQLDPFFTLTARALDALDRARKDAHDRALVPMVQAISAFETNRNQAKRIARSIGFKC